MDQITASPPKKPTLPYCRTVELQEALQLFSVKIKLFDSTYCFGVDSLLGFFFGGGEWCGGSLQVFVKEIEKLQL